MYLLYFHFIHPCVISFCYFTSFLGQVIKKIVPCCNATCDRREESATCSCYWCDEFCHLVCYDTVIECSHSCAPKFRNDPLKQRGGVKLAAKVAKVKKIGEWLY
jgi:hypothetical protein